MTNVQKIAHLICTRDADGVSQLTHYHPGVGTSGNWFQKLMGGVAGAGLDQNIIDAYRFIVLNYEEGDLNFLFGFSRGAYTARSLAGFIVNCGILKKEFIGKLNEAFAFYRDRTAATHPNSEAALKFKAAYSHPPAVEFIGVWDTVGDLGIPIQPLIWLDRDKYKFHDTELSSIVNYAFHALAIDEHTKIFNETLWQRSANGKLRKERAIEKDQVIEQVWFPGAHCNIGGGYVDTGLSDATLEWMIGNAEKAGLAFNYPLPPDIKPDIINGILRNSCTFWWQASQYFLPFYRTIFVQDSTFIDQSVTDDAYLRPDYPAPNIPPLVPEVQRLAPGQEIILTIQAAQPYSFAMLSVEAGEQYGFSCDPKQRWHDAWVSAGPGGYFNPLSMLAGLRLKGAPCFCLCGVYECNDATAFPIGAGTSITAVQTGMISFFANDTPGFYFNNKGSLQVTIIRTA